MKITKYLSLIAVAAVFSACDSEDFTGHSEVVKNDVNLSFVTPPSAQMVEQDAEYTITANLDKAQTVDVLVPVSQVGGTADGDDYHLSSGLIVIPAGQTTGSVTLEVVADATPEERETLEIQVGGPMTGNANFTPQTFTLTLDNYVSPALDVILDWSGSYVQGGEEFDFCDVDMDILVVDNDGFDTGNLTAQTGSCPEHLVVSGLEDGIYHLYGFLYAAELEVGSGPIAEYPITATFSRDGSFSGVTVNQLPEEVFNSEMDDYANDDAVNFNYITSFEVSGDEYIIYDAEDFEVARGKVEHLQSYRAK